MFAKDYQRVSIIQLIGNPDRYEGLEVRVSGYLVIKREGDALYLSKEHSDHSLSENALWINLSNKEADQWESFSHSYVTIYGEFSSSQKGHGSLFSGELKEIFKIYQIPNTKLQRTN